MPKWTEGEQLKPKDVRDLSKTPQAPCAPNPRAYLGASALGGEARSTEPASGIPESGAKPGFYGVVSRSFVAQHDDVSTVICAPVYGEILGLTTEVVLGPEDGLPRTCPIRWRFSSR